MANKIAQGTTGQADVQRDGPAFGPPCSVAWGVSPPYPGIGGDNTNPNGWNVTREGMITVPSNAPFGTILATYTTGEPESDTDPGQGCKRFRYSFEVVCMTTEITVIETYRDEDKYHLSCTATPQGGTAPYTYDWSSSINGSQALSATNQATLEVEIPAIGVGTISVAVSDSSDPACTASASFDVCGNVNCDFTTSLISTPPTGDTGPYIYECVSSSIGVGDLVHEWSPGPIEVSEDGRVAKFSFPDDDEHSIDLTVKDFSGCRGFKTHKVGGYEFTISTDPSGEDMGTVSGTRDTMKFTVTVKAQATGNFTGTPPSQLTFEFSRSATNEVGTAVAPLIAGSSPPRYEFPWLVRQAKGRWQIKVQGYKSNTATFKIDKRKQIVEVANSWVGARQDTGHNGPYCDDLCRYFYEYTGLSVGGGGNNVVALYNSMNTASQDIQKAAIAFYHFPADTNTTWRHNALNIGGGQIVDQNCGLPHSVYPTYTDRFGYVQTDNDHPPTVGQHSDTDADLVKPTKYAAPSYHTTTELQQLDNE